MTHDDPRLTEYALGELDGPDRAAERAEVEAALAADAGLRAEVEAIRASAGFLRGSLAAEAVPVLDPAHRGVLEEAMGDLGGLSPKGTVPACDDLKSVAGTPQGRRPTGASAIPWGPAPLRDSPPERSLRRHAGLGALAATLLVAIGFAVAGGAGSVDFGAQSSPRSSSLLAPSYTGTYSDSEIVILGSTPTNGQETRVPLSDPELDSRISVAFAGTRGGGAANIKRPWDARTRAKGYVYRDGTVLAGEIHGGTTTISTTTTPVQPGHWGQYRGAKGEIPPDSRQPHDPSAPDSGGGTPTPPDGGGGTSTPPEDLNSPIFGKTEESCGESSTESFGTIVENAWIRPLGEAALSTFSIDVDTAAYSIVRRCLAEQGRLPPPGALRIEELVNYFPYSYAPPSGSDPFAVHVDAATCPWDPRHRLVRIALKGREVEEALRPAANIVLLVDVSGSMSSENKLPLVKKSIAMLAERLTARDRVAMVVYAGSSGLVLPATAGDRRTEILGAIERLSSGGSTNGGAGIELAYKVAAENFVPGGINRVVLATDGDFNVGVSDPSALVKLVEEKAKTGVFLTALGYGMDNLKDSTLEQLADKGNGNYGYVDSLREAQKVLVDEGMSTLHAIAKDVKIQVEFNPVRVAAFRLLGYENRVLAAQDFNDDAKDAGEIGAGHTVTAFYEVVPAGDQVPGAAVDELRYQRIGGGAVIVDGVARYTESLTVKLRWKEPEGTTSTLCEVPFSDDGRAFDAASEDFRFAASVAAFGMVLRDSAHKGDAGLPMVREIAAGALGDDRGGYRAEFLTLVDRAAAIK